MFIAQDDLPTGLWVEAQCAKLSAQAIPYYITQKGNHGSGVVMLKLLGQGANCNLLMQQRNLDGNMEWIHALNEETIAESKADAYIKTSITRDPDLWVIEIENIDADTLFNMEI